MTNRYIGIDPGTHGAIAVIEEDNVNVFDLNKEYDTYLYWVSNMEDLLEPGDNHYAAVEDVCGRPGQSCQANTTFMKLAGMAEVMAYGIGRDGFIKVKPQVWKKHFGLITKGLTKTERKHLSIDLAKKLFPAVADQLTASKDGRAEALLIARYMKDVQCQQELCRDSSKTDTD
jgi:hypothetical protein